FRDVPVLTELACEVAARGAERQDARAWIEMMERFLFDRIDAETARAAVGGQHHAVADALPHEAHAALAVLQLAIAWTRVAMDAASIGAMPPACEKFGHGALSSK